MNTEKKKQLLDKLNKASFALDEYEEGPLAIGQMGIAIQSCIDVLYELIQEVSEARATADMASAVLGRLI